VTSLFTCRDRRLGWTLIDTQSLYSRVIIQMRCQFLNWTKKEPCSVVECDRWKLRRTQMYEPICNRSNWYTRRGSTRWPQTNYPLGSNSSLTNTSSWNERGGSTRWPQTNCPIQAGTEPSWVPYSLRARGRGNITLLEGTRV
jgi:hypothetical protein